MRGKSISERLPKGGRPNRSARTISVNALSYAAGPSACLLAAFRGVALIAARSYFEACCSANFPITGTMNFSLL